jgi:hypothetical protein
MPDGHNQFSGRNGQGELSLYSGGEIVINGVFYCGQRQQLDEHSWVELIPGLLSGGDMLLDRLLSSSSWEQRQRWMYSRKLDEPRPTAEYPDGFGSGCRL